MSMMMMMMTMMAQHMLRGQREHAEMLKEVSVKVEPHGPVTGARRYAARTAFNGLCSLVLDC
eukprot:3134422-Amphidinium_carterae.2